MKVAPPQFLPCEDHSERAALERLARLGVIRLGTSAPMPSAAAPLPQRLDCDVPGLLAATRADL